MAKSMYEDLREEIVTGVYPPGEALRENTLADRFGTSRTPVREALRRLEQDGLVERGARGMQVRAPKPEEILEIYEVRIVLEAAAARAAAERRTEFDLLRLEQIHEAMLSAESKDPDQMVESNRRFHEHVWIASHNSTLVTMLHRLNAHLVQYRDTTLTHGDRWKVVLKDHEAMLSAIRGRDAESAADLAEKHMTGARNARLQMYAEAVDD